MNYKQKGKIKYLFLNGMCITAISRKLKITPSEVKEALKKYGVEV